MESTASQHQFSQAAAPAPWAQWMEKAARMVLRAVEAHAKARQAQATAVELQGLSERELEDIGLTRGDVDLMTASSGGASARGCDWSLRLQG